MKIALDIMKDASEIVHYNIPELSILVEKSLLSEYPDMRAFCHWHEDIEFTTIPKGQMNYYVNGEKILLNQGDIVMVNSRQMHYGYSYLGKDCEFLCLVFRPQLLFGNTSLYDKYVVPVLTNQNLEYMHFMANNSPAAKINALLNAVFKIWKCSETAYEMELLSTLTFLWSKIIQKLDVMPSEAATPLHNDLIAQKNMVAYIQCHYTEKITLNDIAAAGNVYRNKCCSIFRHYLGQTPIDFLNTYRLKVSCHLLLNTSANICDIAFACGFNHLSYFSKLFYRKYGYTPNQYRKLQTKPGQKCPGF